MLLLVVIIKLSFVVASQDNANYANCNQNHGFEREMKEMLWLTSWLQPKTRIKCGVSSPPEDDISLRVEAKEGELERSSLAIYENWANKTDQKKWNRYLSS